MSTTRRLAVGAVAMICAAALTACSSSATKDDAYKKARALPPLEVPPDLINPPKDQALALPTAPSTAAPAAAAPATTPAEQAASTPSPASAAPAPAMGVADQAVRLQRDGAQRWLVATGDVTTVTRRVHEFLLQEGYDIVAEDLARGSIETEWRAADAGHAGDKGKEKLNEALSAGWQDKFRVRVEAGRASGTAEIYVSHLGLQRVDGDERKWQPRPNDPALEADLLRRLQDFFSSEAAHPEPALDLPKARSDISTSQDGVTTLRINEDFERAWRRIGFALGRGGFVIEDRNRNEGLYLIRLGRAFKEDAKAGFFNRLFGASGGDPDARFRVFLQGRGNDTAVVVQHPGGAAVRTSIGERILNRLQEKME